MKVYDIARICHEANHAYCLALNDHSQVAWHTAPEWQRNSVIEGVRFALAHPSATPRDSHESWLALKQSEGWKYGPVKDVSAREHPCFLPYDELPEAQRAKDELFLAIVNVFRKGATE